MTLSNPMNLDSKDHRFDDALPEHTADVLSFFHPSGPKLGG